MVNPSEVTVYISYVRDTRYLKSCLSIIKKVKFFENIKVNLDGWKTSVASEFLDDPLVESVTNHAEKHGKRYYNLLKEAPTEKVLFLDSDFFCSDNSFWEKAWEMSEKYPMVSIGRDWNFGLVLPSTPYLLVKKDILNVLPDANLWNHFGGLYPDIPDPFFDHFQFLFLLCLKNNLFGCVDVWYPLKKKTFKFHHIWGSRSLAKEDLAEYEKTQDKFFLARYACKKLLFFFLEGEELPQEIWEMVDGVVGLKPHPVFLDMMDMLYNVGYQFDVGERLHPFVEKFYKRYPSISPSIKDAEF